MNTPQINDLMKVGAVMNEIYSGRFDHITTEELEKALEITIYCMERLSDIAPFQANLRLFEKALSDKREALAAQLEEAIPTPTPSAPPPRRTRI